tara:strand:- start:68 stop:1345 length:1278 start_codon:yes stop_codon:yes gene_type:complete
MAQYGLIYIVSNQSYGKNVFKVGKTSRPIDERLSELSSDTAVIGNFEVYATFLVDDIDLYESQCHKFLDEYRMQSNREFFEIDYSFLYTKVKEILDYSTLDEKVYIEPDEEKIKSREEYKSKVKRKKESMHKGEVDLSVDLKDLVSEKLNKVNAKKEEEQAALEQKNKSENKISLETYERYIRKLNHLFLSLKKERNIIYEETSSQEELSETEDRIVYKHEVRILICKGTSKDIAISKDYFTRSNSITRKYEQEGRQLNYSKEDIEFIKRVYDDNFTKDISEGLHVNVSNQQFLEKHRDEMNEEVQNIKYQWEGTRRDAGLKGIGPPAFRYLPSDHAEIFMVYADGHVSCMINSTGSRRYLGERTADGQHTYTKYSKVYNLGKAILSVRESIVGLLVSISEPDNNPINQDINFNEDDYKRLEDLE